MMHGVMDEINSSQKYSVIRTHCRTGDPFTRYTAAFKLAHRLCQKKTVVITSSWVDELDSSLSTDPDRKDPDSLKRIVDWIILSRILDRVALRYGATYFLTQKSASTISTQFCDFCDRPDVSVIHRKMASFDDILLQERLLQATYPDSAFNPMTMNLSGNLSNSKFLLVGDQINPKFNHFEHWPFHDRSGSAFFITSVLNQLGVDETQLCWSNANAKDTQPLVRFMAERPEIISVALGHDAERGLIRIGIEPNYRIPHPSWVSRFNKRDEYADSIQSIIDQV